MTRPLRSSSDASAGYTRLERAVFQALAAELAAQVADLARQVAASRPTVRKNSGFGVFTETAVPSSFHPSSAATGDLGSVHAVLAGLREPVRFTARLQHGRLVGLMGDSYGQDTRQIDFATAHVTQLFTLDPSGRSIPVIGQDPPPIVERPVQTPRPRPKTASVPTTPVQPPLRPLPARPSPPPASNHSGPAASADLMSLIFGPKSSTSRNPAREPPGDADRVSLLIGLWVVLAVGVILAELILDIPWLIAAIAAFWIGLSLSKPRGLAALRKGLDAWKASRGARR